MVAGGENTGWNERLALAEPIQHHLARVYGAGRQKRGGLEGAEIGGEEIRVQLSP